MRYECIWSLRNWRISLSNSYIYPLFSTTYIFLFSSKGSFSVQRPRWSNASLCFMSTFSPRFHDYFSLLVRHKCAQFVVYFSDIGVHLAHQWSRHCDGVCVGLAFWATRAFGRCFGHAARVPGCFYAWATGNRTEAGKAQFNADEFKLFFLNLHPLPQPNLFHAVPVLSLKDSIFSATGEEYFFVPWLLPSLSFSRFFSLSLSFIVDSPAQCLPPSVLVHPRCFRSCQRPHQPLPSTPCRTSRPGSRGACVGAYFFVFHSKLPCNFYFVLLQLSSFTILPFHTNNWRAAVTPFAVHVCVRRFGGRKRIQLTSALPLICLWSKFISLFISGFALWARL